MAITLVLLFHAGLGFSGGFIGVDVFFVISGYVITALILREQDIGNFSLIKFWVRRIRRIIPAAVVMVLVALSAGFFLLFPMAYAELGKSAIAQQLILSNVYFWRNTGYFAGDSELKPLLHTWSLAIEDPRVRVTTYAAHRVFSKQVTAHGMCLLLCKLTLFPADAARHSP